MKKQKKLKQRGITLIALVVTIVVLLIIAGVSISMLAGENSIINKAQNAKEQTEEAEKDEANNLDKAEGSIDNYLSGDSNEVKFKKGVNEPKLLSDMVAVYWDTAGNEIYSKINGSGQPSSLGEDNTNFDWNAWYDYVAQAESVDGTSKWANAITDDGNYWVWIPRFAYKITSGLKSSTTGEIEIKFLKGKSNEDSSGNKISKEYPTTTGDAMDDFVIHPSFVNGTANNFANGEWDSELEGYWVAKYKVSTSYDDTTGNALPVVNAGEYLWDYQAGADFASAYAISNTYKMENNSHLIKNSEWGAIAYLTQSNYGRNGISVTANNSAYTGGSLDATATTNVLQSSTGNAYGVFDLYGYYEYVAGYAGFANEMTTGLTFAYRELPPTITSGTYFDNEIGLENKMINTKYITVYPCVRGDEDYWESINNYNIYAGKGGFGDAILETSMVDDDQLISWENKYSDYTNKEAYVFSRGDVGIFSYDRSGGYSTKPYRIVLTAN